MDYVLYITGFILGVALFLYGLSFFDSGKKKIKNLSSPGNKGNKKEISINPQNISFKDLPAHPRKRVCPVCGSILSKYEALYASQFESSKGKKVLIYGCRYCYKPEEDPEQKRKSNI